MPHMRVKLPALIQAQALGWLSEHKQGASVWYCYHEEGRKSSYRKLELCLALIFKYRWGTMPFKLFKKSNILYNITLTRPLHFFQEMLGSFTLIKKKSPFGFSTI